MARSGESGLLWDWANGVKIVELYREMAIRAIANDRAVQQRIGQQRRR